MKRILLSIAVIAVTTGALLGGTTAFFSDVETSSANTFTAGALDLKVDNESYYNGNKCAEVTPGVWQWQGEASYPVVGTPCTTSWTLTDLDKGNLFFDFTDVKPDDEGEDTISLHVQNDAYACMDMTLTKNDDNSSNEPELKTGDAVENALNSWDGELAQAIQMLWWADDGDNVYEVGEPVISGGVKTLMDLASTSGAWSVALADATHNVWGTPGPIKAEETAYIAKAWCFGTLTPAALPDNADTGPLVRGTGILCDGKTLGNETQTDTATLDIQFRTEQARHNGRFLCNEEVVVEPENGTLTIVKNIVGNEAAPDDFDFVVNEGVPTSFEVDGTNVISVAPGMYDVVETPAEGYTTTYANSLNGNSNCTDLVVPSEGNVTCTITNTFVPQTGTLVIEKVLVGAPEGVDVQDFTFQVNGDTPVAFEADASNAFVLAPGQYSVVENAEDNFTSTYASVNGANCNNLQVIANAQTVCTITNTYDPTTVTIQKNVVGGTLTAGDFSFELDTVSASLNTAHVVTPGAHLVEEVNTPSNYVVTYGGACDTDGNITAVANENVTCTITNTFAPTTITIEKNVVGGTAVAGDFSFQIDSNSAVLGANAVTAGAHTVSEVNIPANYVASYSGGCDTNGGITAVANQNVTCTITNTFVPPIPTTITITKSVVGGTATTGSFTYRIDGNAVPLNTANTVAAGAHTVTETGGPANYVATFGGSCNGAGQITAVSNTNVTCTITNTFVPPTPTSLLSDGFGTGATDDTFNETPSWAEAGNTGNDAEKRQAAGGGSNDSASSNGDRFALMLGENGHICRTVNATGYNTLTLSYLWRGDFNAESDDDGIVEYATGGTCASPTGLTTLVSHPLDTTTWQTNSINLPGALSNTSFFLRFRVNSSQPSEDFRIDGVSLTGVAL